MRIASKWSEVCETLDGVMSRRLRSARIASSCSPADVGDVGVRCGVSRDVVAPRIASSCLPFSFDGLVSSKRSSIFPLYRFAK